MKYRLQEIYFFLRSLPLDVKQIIIDFAAADIWRDNVEECILIQIHLDPALYE